MATYYVGAGGNNDSDGLSWANRKLTLNGAEDIPVQAGDTVYVGPGVYRETLTVDVSGSSGNVISYIGDYDGTHTDGVGGIARITGSDNDQAPARNTCIVASGKHYRSFAGFQLDGTIQYQISGTDCTDWTISECYMLGQHNYANIQAVGTGQARWTIDACYALLPMSAVLFQAYAASDTDNAGHVVTNSIAMGHGGHMISSNNVGGITVKNCLSIGNYYGIRVGGGLAAGQTVSVTNCIFYGTQAAFSATAVGEIVEDYNCLYAVATPRINTDTGAHSNTFIYLPDARWFFEAVNGGTLATPFDHSAWSQLIDVAGTAPTTTDLRGATVLGTQREWGALEYNSALAIEGGVACDYPAEADVEFGVTYSIYTGTFVVPAEADVEAGVEYGDSAEFTGTLVVGGGGPVRILPVMGGIG